MKEMVDLVKRFERLRQDTEEVLSAMKPAAFPGAINWGDLGVDGVYMGLREDGSEVMLVCIEEVAPEEHAFCRYIEERLEARGWASVEVLTRW